MANITIIKRALFAMLILTLAPVSMSSSYQSNEELKVSLIYQFAKYTHWPSSSHSAMTFCVLGNNRFYQKMNRIVGKKIAGKLVSSRHVTNIEQVDKHQCQVIYIAPTLASELPAILAYLSEKPILTISEIKDFTLKGGMINFINKAQRQHFEVSRRATQKTGLTISSKLLQVAYITD